MALGRDGVVVRQLRTLFSVGTVGELTDGQLLERFAASRGEAAELAFAVLLERHGPMVLRVCRGVLRTDSQDTQDAFQATFLVLVKKARGLWVRDSLGPWLHQVAYRTASCARSSAARRRRHERGAAFAATTAESRAEPDDDLGRVLHEEIDGLPERYRAPLVLCDLEGSSYEQAARHLGWPVGTVKSRHSRGRQRLRDRLIRRGMAPGTALIAAAPRPGSADALVPPSLLDSTTRAAIQLATVRTFVAGSAASLAQGVLRSMITIRWFKAVSVLLVLGATASAVDLLAWRGTAGGEPQAKGNAKVDPKGDDSVFVVKPGKFTVTIDQRKGLLESSESEDVFCQVEGRTTIISILLEGTRVKKGDLVCELDSSGLQDRLKDQWIAATVAEAAYRSAQSTSEVAEIAVVEYVQGIYPSELATLNDGIAAAESAVLKAEARLERARVALRQLRALLATNEIRKATVEIVAELDLEDRIAAAEQDVSRAKMALEQARSKRDVLEKYTRGKTTRELQSEVKKAKSLELAKQQTWELENDKKAKLEKQIKNCKLFAPEAGIVVYANDPRRFGNNPDLIEEGAAVRERQKIFSLPNIAKMRVNIKVPESIVARIKHRLPVRIRVDAFAHEVLTGSVESINPLPDPGPSKVFMTRVTIEKPLAGLRPGMSAGVEILTELDNVLSVPAAAVAKENGKDYVAVKIIGGGVEWREVILGRSDGDRVEVRSGIESGDLVFLDPIAAVNPEKAEGNDASKPSAASPGGR